MIFCLTSLKLFLYRKMILGHLKKNNNSREEESGQGKPSRPDEEEKATAKCSDEMEYGPAKQPHSYFEGTESKDDEPHSLKKR